LVAIVLPATALGGRFQVRPVKIYFDARTKITSFKVISSEEKNILTLQIQTVTWSQDGKGKDQYGDTKDLLVFPKLFKLQPRSERVVRVAFRAKKDPRREHTYRIFVEELPVEGRGETTITITLKLGMPVFVQPAQGKDDWSIEGLTLEKGRARVAIGNNGNQHLIVREIAATGADAGGEKVYSRTVSGWYVLAGSQVSFFVPISREKCLKLHTLKVSVKSRSNVRKEAETKVTPNPSLCSAPKK